MTLPALSTAQMIEVDRLMIEKYGIALIPMMENAGRQLADLISVESTLDRAWDRQ